jgi:hypothetical protein
MKRFSAKLIAMMLCCLMVVSLAACDKDLSGGALSSLTKPNSSPVEPEILVTDPLAAVDVQIPFGYVEYNDGFVSFAYPEGWVIEPGEVTVISDTSGTSSNITIANEMYSSIYDSLTAKQYIDLVGEAYAASGLEISNVVVTQTYSGSGEKVTKITHTTSTSGIVMEQTLLVIGCGHFNYVVTATELESTELVDVVLETLHSVD